MSESLLGKIGLGTLLLIDNEIEGEVIGYIDYRNPGDGNKTWREYRVLTKAGVIWLSIDEHYKEYSVSFPVEMEDGQLPPIWRKVDEGTQVVVYAAGDVDVDEEESAHFVEFEDDTEENIYSLETWEDGTEASNGYYLDEEEIQIVGQKTVNTNTGRDKKIGCGCASIFYAFTAMIILFAFGIPAMISDYFGWGPGINDYLKGSKDYQYVTSITGNEKQKASVYENLRVSDDKGGYNIRQTVDDVAKDIIKGIEGKTEMVSENTENGINKSISIVTRKEYCLIYYEEDNPEKVLVQISNRKYNYTSDNTPYRAGSAVTGWYRSHYYSSAYTKDSTTWKSTPSAYTMYDGPIMHDLGNGYFDVYSNNIRQESIRRRNSSEGGVNRGK